MKFLLTVLSLVFFLSGNAQDSLRKDHKVFRYSGLSLIGGINPNQGDLSRKDLLNIWPDFASKPYARYYQSNSGQSRSTGIFGAYLIFDNTCRKKIPLHAQTNVGISIYSIDMPSAYHETTASRIDTLYTQSGNALYAQYYRDDVKIKSVYLNYQAFYAGLDIQQIVSTDPKRTFSVFGGLGASACPSFSSHIYESFHETKGTNITEDPGFNYNNNNTYLNLYQRKDSAYGFNSYEVKSAVSFRFYAPFGYNIRLRKKESSRLSHIYLSNQFRVGYQIVKMRSVSPITSMVTVVSWGICYKF